MKLLIFGASGKVGQLVVDEALRRGHTVSAFVHTSRLKDRKNLVQIEGDIYDRASVDGAIARGHDAIISTLGSWGREQQNVVSTATQKIVPAAERAGIQRIVSLTGHLSKAPGDKDKLPRKVARALANAGKPKILRDGEDHIAILAASKLNWTVVRSPVMTNKYETHYALSLKAASLNISRQAVAEAMLNLAEGGDWPRSAPFIRRV